MSNSSLVKYTKISPNKTSPRTGKIDRITIHHMAGNCKVTSCGDIFANPARRGSSNYGIGTDGMIALYVDEKDRSWCSSNASNDHRAVTIEVADDINKKPWHCSEKAMSSLILLCVDICKRNGIKELKWTGTTSGNLTTHDMFANTDCPGDYLKKNMGKIASEVNKMLKYNVTTYTWSDSKTSTVVIPTTDPTPAPTKTKYTGTFPTLPSRGYFKKGDSGTQVKNLQKFLLWWDAKCLPKYGADGDYGDETIAAVKKFQAAMKITADGLFGKSSLDKAKSVTK